MHFFVYILLFAFLMGTRADDRVTEQKYSKVSLNGYKSINSPGKAPGTPSAIVGGFPVAIDRIPYQLSVRRYGKHICGASIISLNYALSAAHCFANPFGSIDVREYTLMAGSELLYEGGSLHEISDVKLHNLFDFIYLETLDYDISAIKVASPFEYSNKIYPILLPSHEKHLEPGTLATISGWGKTNEYSYVISNKLQAVGIPVFDHKLCEKIMLSYGYSNTVTPRMICAGFDLLKKDACQGDSGGPMVVGYTLVGIVSWGIGCARPGIPGVYTDLNNHEIRNWIKLVTDGI